MVTIAVVAMGEMGAAIAGRLVERGARVLTSLAGRSESSRERAKQAGVEAVSDEALVEQCDMILSIVPPAAAIGTAERYLPLIERFATKPIYIDCNAIAPQTLSRLSAPFLERNLRVGDASIIGWPPKPEGYSPHIYMAGDVSAEAETLASLGLETRVISDSLGSASAVKMAYAGITKGMQAIGTAMAIGAARSGAAEAFVAELQETQPQLYAWLCRMLPVMARKAYRWDDEMLEISAFLEPERGAADMLTGAAALYREVAEHHRQGPDSEILGIVERFVSAAN